VHEVYYFFYVRFLSDFLYQLRVRTSIKRNESDFGDACRVLIL
jgi:hypothetical protein